MPLRSQLFSGNKKLQACLTSDAAHVTPGARGEHVALIQSALVRLRFLKVEDVREEVKFYGPRTTAAVLAYKQEFKIINRNYQTKADKIVGKMTIASLDHGMLVLDDMIGGPRLAPPPGPHPKSPTPGSPSRAPVAAKALANAPAPPTAAPSVAAPSVAAFGPPLSGLPDDIQAVIRRSNDAKVPGVDLLVPFLEKNDGPLSAAELTKRFAGGHSVRIPVLTGLHARMLPFNIWPNIKIIREVYIGKNSSSLGIFCEPFDHEAFFHQMSGLTKGPERFPPPGGGVGIPITDSRFCKDMFNVHGARDSFREIVKQGPGLHICIAQPAVRSQLSCDLHIDAIQQGSICSRGSCIPLVNGQTIEHLRTVGPWLAEQAGKLVPKF